MLLYRLISGVQSNINMHISQYYFDKEGYYVYPNHLEYIRRVGGNKERIENLYFTYSFILSAFDKLYNDIQDYVYTKYNKTENTLLKNKMRELNNQFLSAEFKSLNEDRLLTSVSKQEFASQVQPHFFNITRLIDCVTCEKCKLHGKLQFNGMAAAMKVMFPHKQQDAITRNEFVGFINLMRKLSNSVHW